MREIIGKFVERIIIGQVIENSNDLGGDRSEEFVGGKSGRGNDTFTQRWNLRKNIILTLFKQVYVWYRLDRRKEFLSHLTQGTLFKKEVFFVDRHIGLNMAATQHFQTYKTLLTSGLRKLTSREVTS